MILARSPFVQREDEYCTALQFAIWDNTIKCHAVLVSDDGILAVTGDEAAIVAICESNNWEYENA